MGLACGMPASAAKGNTVSKLTAAPKSSLLSDQSLSVVQATAPVVVAHADQITAGFYPRMFAAHPELLRVCNRGNQATEPSDGGALPAIAPGQYVSVFVDRPAQTAPDSAA
jgi:hypothetical protein